MQFEGRPVLVTESGLLAAAHLVGTGSESSPKGLVAIFKGINVTDGYGVNGLTYMYEFGGFQTPYNLDPDRNWVEEEKKRFIAIGQRPRIAIRAGDYPYERPTFYIWRSRDDPKVRPQHRAFDDKRFSVANPPQGGPPGAEFGCRCYAEWLIKQDYPAP